MKKKIAAILAALTMVVGVGMATASPAMASDGFVSSMCHSDGSYYLQTVDTYNYRNRSSLTLGDVYDLGGEPDWDNNVRLSYVNADVYNGSTRIYYVHNIKPAATGDTQVFWDIPINNTPYNTVQIKTTWHFLSGLTESCMTSALHGGNLGWR